MIIEQGVIIAILAGAFGFLLGALVGFFLGVMFETTGKDE